MTYVYQIGNQERLHSTKLGNWYRLAVRRCAAHFVSQHNCISVLEQIFYAALIDMKYDGWGICACHIKIQNDHYATHIFSLKEPNWDMKPVICALFRQENMAALVYSRNNAPVCSVYSSCTRDPGV